MFTIYKKTLEETQEHTQKRFVYMEPNEESETVTWEIE